MCTAKPYDQLALEVLLASPDGGLTHPLVEAVHDLIGAPDAAQARPALLKLLGAWSLKGPRARAAKRSVERHLQLALREAGL